MPEVTREVTGGGSSVLLGREEWEKEEKEEKSEICFWRLVSRLFRAEEVEQFN